MRAKGLTVLFATIATAMLVLPGNVRAEQREPGGSAAVATVATAKVKSIDPEARTVTLETADGESRTIKCGKEVVNFDQIKVGDVVKAVAIERVAVAVGRPGAADAKPDSGAAIARAPKGDKPGIIIANTDATTAKIAAVDAAGHTVKLEGQDQPVKVASDVDLTGVKQGDEVTVRMTKGIALWVEKPEDGAQPAAARIVDEAAEVASATATVEAIDSEKRIVTLKTAKGETRKIHLGKEAVNFNQIAVGDKVRATLAEEVAIAVSKGGAAPGAGEGAVIARAPRGAKPGMVIAESTQVTGKIQSIDAEKRTITLAEADGKPKTIKAGQRVDLSELKAGDDITARVTQALAIVVEKP
jgi:Cu/Ag efflux protein CusF